MTKYLITRLDINHVLDHYKILYNTGNHRFSETEEKPQDYYQVIKQCDTCNWIDKFHTDYQVIDLDNESLKWMSDAVKRQNGLVVSKFPDEFVPNLDQTCNRYKHTMIQGENKKWFVRTDSVSLKEGIHGVGPYNNIRAIIESMVTSKPTHRPFIPGEPCRIYLLKWLDIDIEKEFRVFVYRGEVTAISAQRLERVNKWLSSMDDHEIYEIIDKIVQFNREYVAPKLVSPTLRSDELNYVMDMCLLGDTLEPYFIEINSFGAHYGTGSGLYHWIYDHDTLHESDPVELRFAVDPS
eukprot:Pompholyxophrys_sp_v1_NODE_34_length_3454_cov_2.369520.p1 type:complete len:295 gc:universal NODE_34_length_3454_cov_2.369520:2398-1514(-)